MEIVTRIVTAFPPEFLSAAARLYRIAGWVDADDPCCFLKAALENSCVVCAAYCGEAFAGMGRALGDGVSDAYIQDVVVAPEFRRRGVGGAVVKRIVAELRSRGVDWISLVGAPGTAEFYRSLGFTSPKDFTFWKVPEA